MQHLLLLVCLFLASTITPSSASSDWINFSGALQEISVGNDGLLMGVNAQGYIYQRTNNGWALFDGILAQVSVGDADNIWGVNANQQIFKWDTKGGKWETIPGLLREVSAACDGTVWGLNNDDQIFSWDPTKKEWTSIPGQLKQISVGNRDTVWGVNASNQIYQWDPKGSTWISVPGLLTQVAVGCDGTVWGINQSNLIYAWDAGKKEWVSVPGELAQVTVGNQSNIWGINASDQIYMNTSWSEPQDLGYIPVGSQVAFTAMHHSTHTQSFQVVNGGGSATTFATTAGASAPFPISGVGADLGFFEGGAGLFTMEKGLKAQFFDSASETTQVSRTNPTTFAMADGGGFAFYGNADLSTRLFLYWFPPLKEGGQTQATATETDGQWSTPISISFVPQGNATTFMAIYESPKTQKATVANAGTDLSFANLTGESVTFPISGKGASCGFFENGVGLFKMADSPELALLNTAEAKTTVAHTNPTNIYLNKVIGGTNLYTIQGADGSLQARFIIIWYAP